MTARMARGQRPQHGDDLLCLQPCLGFLGAGKHAGRLGDLADGQPGRVHGVTD
jgi:hypothetical protein